ncbi:phage tail protein [Phototrophicus methaneseepsis]|uniref:Phage tail protein n=1 Tax=Phototrophicus methaneseepsis TaxID=2710758 RepID=A0A7S8E9C2_9CHLR|nr:phage tail protein [Phototrophicus methaneseepsis]QPC82764.1 phage tail protein [Phototrophicus methaneseepsis]
MTHREGDPFGNFNFLVEIDGIGQMACHSITGLNSETEVMLHRSGNDRVSSVRKLPGLTKYGNVTLKRGYTGARELYDWRKQVIDGMFERRSVVVSILNEKREPIARYLLKASWPCRWEVSTFDGKGNEVLIEEIVLAVEAIDWQE